MIKLIGMLDSPYVRRTAISLEYLGVPFEHQAVSVFNHFELFQTMNPVVKAPTLLFDNGDVLMDSTFIIQYAESIAPHGNSLMPANDDEHAIALQFISIALAATEKAVQLVYEKQLRPLQYQYEPWIRRVTLQLNAACNLLEQKLVQNPVSLASSLTQPYITAAVAWQFMQSMLADILPAIEYPHLQALSNHAEKLPVFLAYPPIGPGVNA